MLHALVLANCTLHGYHLVLANRTLHGYHEEFSCAACTEANLPSYIHNFVVVIELATYTHIDTGNNF